MWQILYPSVNVASLSSNSFVKKLNSNKKTLLKYTHQKVVKRADKYNCVSKGCKNFEIAFFCVGQQFFLLAPLVEYIFLTTFNGLYFYMSNTSI